ncbi:MAG: hypothetical protein ACYTXA_20675 [Nostoc sp.]
MTNESQSNNSDKEEFDPVTDPRDWSAAETELACFALARSKGKRLVQRTGDKFCIPVWSRGMARGF